ncbi:MAG: DedA protein [uncultured Rubrobacteraceae bacterium]|uniref:DedA protein n=1 Tax=uncultured Rubrobacteraceae bacterium TaxID=349277 RepID=A0A6J4R0P0_9ACTN|nr:MAG: DedA protein [uncultured Rubrobacteraceae bacterium]
MESILNFFRSIPDSPGGVLDFVTGLLLEYGYLVIFLGAALDNFGLPSSGDVVLFAGGFFANNGQAALPLVMLTGFAGALVSDNSVYWIGKIGGRPLIHRILKVRLLHFLINEKSLEKVERYFESHGGKTVFAGRFGPGLRSMTPLFAGVTGMRYYRFVPYNVAAGLVWAVAYSLIGYVFGQYWGELLAVAKSFGFGVVALAVLVLLAFFLRRRYRRREEG